MSGRGSGREADGVSPPGASPALSHGHRVDFVIDEYGIESATVVCLNRPGADCRTGCPVPDCYDWEHGGGGEEGCEHCMDLCNCDGMEDGPCDISRSHGGACPHEYEDLGRCWLLPCLGDWDGLRDDMQPATLAHGRWSVVYTGYDCSEDFAALLCPGLPYREDGIPT